MKKIDLKGKTFGHLLVLRDGTGRRVKWNNRAEVTWICLCDCGREKEISSRALLCKMSISCARPDCQFHNPVRHIDPREPSIRYVFDAYKQNAKNRGYSFNLSLDQLKCLTSQKCRYCGVDPSTTCYFKPGLKYRNTKNKPFVYNGIDRVDNSVGYEIGNCVTCCKTCNIMKQGMDPADFLAHIRKILNHYELAEKIA